MSETQLQMGGIAGRCFASRRFADAIVRSFGASEITIRVLRSVLRRHRQPAWPGSSAGRGPADFPGLLRTLPPAADGSKRIEAMISSTTLAPIAKSHNVTDIGTWLLTAQGLVHNDQLMHIDTVVADRALGSICLYRITATE